MSDINAAWNIGQILLKPPDISRGFIFSAVLILFLLFPSISPARDINLDSIYIKSTSGYLKWLMTGKLDAYQKVGALDIDRDVIFAGWLTGDEIVYAKESAEIEENIIYSYNLNSREKKEITRIKGTITAFKPSPNGRHIIIKRMIQRVDIVPENEICVLYIPDKKITAYRSSSLLMDFSLAQDGNSIFFETNKGIEEFSLYTAISTLIIKRSAYSDIASPGITSIAFFSPDRNTCAILNGESGRYNCKIILKNSSFTISGVSSPAEFFWLDNYYFALRSGHSGNFSAVIYHIEKNTKSILLAGSLNTNITFSENPKILSYLNDQMIHLYFPAKNSIILTGLEGEDISFENSGNLFTALMYKRLFLVNLRSVEKKQSDLKTTWMGLLKAYNELLKETTDHDNEYSPNYINKKINAYRDLIK
jgi:hypothetical protein